MIKVIHNECGKTAFYFRERLVEGEVIRASNVVYLDGSEASPCDAIVCGSCGDLISLAPYSVTQVDEDWKDWFINDEARNNNINCPRSSNRTRAADL